MSPRPKVVVTDYIEPDMDWEAEQMEQCGVDFTALQLKFRPEEEVIAAVEDATVIVVNMVPFPAAVINSLKACKRLIRHGAGYDNLDLRVFDDSAVAEKNLSGDKSQLPILKISRHKGMRQDLILRIKNGSEYEIWSSASN